MTEKRFIIRDLNAAIPAGRAKGTGAVIDGRRHEMQAVRQDMPAGDRQESGS